MQALALAGLGWVVGTVVPGSDRRLRIACTAAALLPELDALARLAGSSRPWGHNIFAASACILAATWAFRRRPPRNLVAALGCVALAFALHLLVELKVWGGSLQLFWPLDPRGRPVQPLLVAGHSISTLIGGILLALPWLLAPWKQVSPLEILSPRLDDYFLNLFRRRNRECSVCGKPGNNRCHACTRPLCLRHGRIGWDFRVTCPPCLAGTPHKGTGEGVEDYIARQLSFLRGKEAVRLDPEFASFLHRKLTDGLRRLDDVPRSHPLWQGSDNRPTLAKLVELSRAILKDSPDDLDARWVLFADRILSNSPDLEYAIIEPAILADMGAIRWLVSGARWGFVFSGTDPVTALKAPLASLGKAVGSLETLLDTLKDDQDPGTKEAALRCLELLNGKNPFKG